MTIQNWLLLPLIILAMPTSAQTKTATYQEPYRPQFHFSPPANWMNDPNGMVYQDGVYHLFYQYYPDSTVWGPMHWAHASSKDLVTWQHLPVALYPDSLGYIFSGSAVVDAKNSIGIKGATQPLVATFTYHNPELEKAKSKLVESQGIAYSVDKGITWTKFEGNPVIPNPGIRDFRDPKVRWFDQGQCWILTMAAGDEVRFYKSTNLKEWSFAGSFGKNAGNHGGVWECPDLIEFKQPNRQPSKWVLLVSVGTGAPNGGSGTQYFTGNFNGQQFLNDRPDNEVQWVDYGTDNYAGVTWSNTGSDVLFLGWMSNWQYAQVVPTSNWRSAMTLPRKLTLVSTKSGWQLHSKPVASLVALRGKRPQPITTGKAYTIDLNELELTTNLSSNTASKAGLVLSNADGEKLVIGYDRGSNRFYIDRTQLKNQPFQKDFSAIQYAPRLSKAAQLKLHVYIDRSSVELFADDGSTCMTALFFSQSPLNQLTLLNEGGKVDGIHGTMYPLQSIWK